MKSDSKEKITDRTEMTTTDTRRERAKKGRRRTTERLTKEKNGIAREKCEWLMSEERGREREREKDGKPSNKKEMTLKMGRESERERQRWKAIPQKERRRCKWEKSDTGLEKIKPDIKRDTGDSEKQ